MSVSTSQSMGGRFGLLLALSSGIFACLCFASAAAAVAALALGWFRLPDSTATDLGESPRVLSSEQALVGEVATEFLRAWQSANWVTAYQLCSPTLQRKVPSAAALGTSIEQARSRPAAWRINRVSAVDEQDTTAEVRATGLFQGKADSILLQLERVGTDWRVGGFRVGP